MRLVKKSWIIGIGFVFLPVVLSLGARLESKKSPSSSTANIICTPSHRSSDILRFTGDEGEIVSPEIRLPIVYNAQAASPYILMHVGAREVDNNGAWKRHAVYRGSVAAGRTIHVLYPVFDGVATTNNRNQYNCLASGATVMTYNDPEGMNNEPNSGQNDQNGGLHASFGDATTAQAVWAGRGIGANTGSIYVEDAASCLGLITVANTPVVPARGLDPDVRVVSAGVSPDSIGVFLSYFNALATIGFTRSLDGGVTWSVPIDCAISSFLNIAVANSASNPKVLHLFSMGTPDSSSFDDVEEILYVKSTDAGATWSPTISVSGPFELPTYEPQYNGSITSLMIGDTAHVFWADHTHSYILPGGHIHHLAVEPSGAIQGPHKVADINIYYDINYDYTSTGLGLGHGLWAGGSGPTVAVSATTGIMYVLWGAPPEDPLVPGKGADSTAAAAAGGRVFYNNDIWMCASATNGRNWDAKFNVTKTNHPGCDGTTVPCEHEFYISAAEVADSVIYVVAQVNKFPGFQSIGDPGPDTRLSDEWRLYLVPARRICHCSGCDFRVTSNDNLGALQVIPGSLKNVNLSYINSGLTDLRLDSIVFTGNLNDGYLVTSRTGGTNIGDPIPQLTSAPLTITFNAAGVGISQTGLRSGQIKVWTHSDSTTPGVPPVALCQIGTNVYVVPSLCLNSADTVHSAANFTEIWSHSVEVFANSLNGMFYFATGENFIFDGGVAIVNPALAGPPGHPRGLRNYFDDQFLRCLTAITVDSIPDPTDSLKSYAIFAKTLSTGRLDSTIIWETIWEQSTNPVYSDFLAKTVRVVNISGADIPDVILGVANDIDVPTEGCPYNGPRNLSFDTSFAATSDGKTYTMLVSSGILDPFSDTLPPVGCTPNDKYFGAITIPNGNASASPVSPRGAVAFRNRSFLPANSWQDSQFVNRMDVIGYHPTRNLADTGLTGMGPEYYPPNPCPNVGSADIGFVIGAKKVTLPKNDIVGKLATRYGLQGLAAGFDTLTLEGPSESFTVLFVAGLSGLADFMANCDAAVSWYNLNANRQVGGEIGPFHRGDLNNDGILTSADVVKLLNKVFLGEPIITSDCAADLNFDNILTAADVVSELHYVFIGTLPTPAYPPMPKLMDCFTL